MIKLISQQRCLFRWIVADLIVLSQQSDKLQLLSFPEFKVLMELKLDGKELRDFDVIQHPINGFMVAYNCWDESTIKVFTEKYHLTTLSFAQKSSDASVSLLRFIVMDYIYLFVGLDNGTLLAYDLTDYTC